MNSAQPGQPAAQSPAQPDAQPSRTALTAAADRAAHLIVDKPPYIFADTLAEALLGVQAGELISYHRAHGGHVVLRSARAQVICRSRFTEDRLAVAVRRGITQYVILGAGLDSFGYRPGLARKVRVFEVDHPATQEWKRAALAAARIPVPDQVSYVPVDFTRDRLASQLGLAGFDPACPALVSWLGVTMYLTRDAIGQTLAAIGGFAPGTELVADYMLPDGLRDPDGDSYAGLVAAESARRGEPWLSFVSPEDMTGLLIRNGFGSVVHISQRDAVEARLWDRSDPLRPSQLSMLVTCRAPEGKAEPRG